MYSIIQSLTCINKENPLPDHSSIQQLANDFADFFLAKIENIRKDIDAQLVEPPVLPSRPECDLFSEFDLLSESDVRKLVSVSKTTSYELDPLPTHLLKQNIDIILPVLTKMINMSLQTGVFPEEWKLALVLPLIKKLGLECIFPNYRPVSNLPYPSKPGSFNRDGFSKGSI